MENKLFRAGVGIADITPPIGLAIEGGFTVVRGEKVLDPLFVTVVALSDGTRTLLLTSIDLCIVSNASYQEMVRLVENTLHLPAESLIIASTHTHGSPLMGTSIFEGIPSDPEYTSYTIKKFITAAKAALDNMADARFAYGKAESRDYLFNRRVVDPQGKIRMNFIDAEYLKDCRVQGEPTRISSFCGSKTETASRWRCWSITPFTTTPTSTMDPAIRPTSPAPCANTSTSCTAKIRLCSLCPAPAATSIGLTWIVWNSVTATTSTTVSACPTREGRCY